MFSNTRKRFLLIIMIFIFSTILFTVPVSILYMNIRGLVIEQLGRNATNVASSIAEVVEQNIDDYTTLISIEDFDLEEYDESYYQSMLAIFRDLKEDIGADYIYTEKMIDNNSIAYIFDGEDINSTTFSPIGSIDVMSEYEKDVYTNGYLVASPIEYYEDWGTFLSGYAPIINDDTNEILGLVGVDFSLEYVSALITSVRLILAISLIFIVLTTTFLIYRLLDLKMEVLNKDYLTGLYSKRFHDAKLQKMTKEATQKNTPLSLLMLDVDYFKEINDKLGHYIGDVVLKEVATVILYNTRNVDICSRYGGDEFLIILPNTLPEVAASIGENIMKNISKIQIANKEINLSVSIGIALWDHSSEISDFITQVDKAMYVSKNTGKNKLTIFN